MRTPARPAPAPSLELQDFLETARPKLLRLLLTLRVPVDDADDVLHDSLIPLLDSWEGIHRIADPEAWVLATLRHKILLYWRRRMRQCRFLAQWSRAIAASEPAPQE